MRVPVEDRTDGEAMRPSCARSAKTMASRVSAAVVAMLLLAQVLSVLHLAVCPHAISAATGLVTHSTRHRCQSEPLRSDSRDGHSALGSTDPCHSGHEDACSVLTALMQTCPVQGFSAAVTAIKAFEPMAVSGVDLFRPNLSNRYRLSPSRSPPSQG